MRGVAFAAVTLLTSAVMGCTARVAGGLDEARANETVAALDEAGIASDKVREGTGNELHFSVEVARGDIGEALRVLASAALPRNEASGIEAMYSEPSLVPSAMEDRAKFNAAVGGELARTLEAIDGVVAARVHVASPVDSDLPLDGERPPPRASVLLTTRRGTHIDTSSVATLVMGAVDGLSPENVAVVTVSAPAAPAPRSRLARVGPFRVAPTSSSSLRTLIVTSFAVHIATATSILVLMRRRRRLGSGDTLAASA